VHKIARENKIGATDRSGGVEHKYHIERPEATLTSVAADTARALGAGAEWNCGEKEHEYQNQHNTKR
jgi:hypothetical protein